MPADVTPVQCVRGEKQQVVLLADDTIFGYADGAVHPSPVEAVALQELVLYRQLYLDAPPAPIYALMLDTLHARGGTASIEHLQADIAPFYAGLVSAHDRPYVAPLADTLKAAPACYVSGTAPWVLLPAAPRPQEVEIIAITSRAKQRIAVASAPVPPPAAAAAAPPPDAAPSPVAKSAKAATAKGDIDDASATPQKRRASEQDQGAGSVIVRVRKSPAKKPSAAGVNGAVRHRDVWRQ